MPSQKPIAKPMQKRSRETLKRILDAFEQALGAKTFEEITVGEICDQARSSVGTFYGRGESKDGLLEHLRDRVYAEAQAGLAELFDPARAAELPLSELLHRHPGSLVDLHITSKGVIREL